MLVSLIADYAEIKNDPKRLEHLESLHAVLTDMMSDSTGSSSKSTVPNKTELMSIYGRVSWREIKGAREYVEEGSRKRADAGEQSWMTERETTQE